MYRLDKARNFIGFKNGKSIKPGGGGVYPVYGANGIIGMSDEYREENSIIIGRVGAYCGSVQYCKGRYWASDNTIVAYPKGNDIDVTFLYYELKNANLNRWAGGAAQPLMTQTVIKQIDLPHPDIEVQRKASSVLSAYDDLIENNTRRIQILEEMAQLIYQEWFVNFRFQGHEKVKFVDSEMGKIPQGWQVKRIGEVLKYHIGGGWGKDVGEGKYCVTAYVIRGTDIPDVRKNNIADCPLRYHTASNYKSRKIESGDVIFEVSGGSKDQPVGRAVLINQNILCSFDQPVICASFCKLMRVNREIISPESFYLKLLSIYDDRSIYKYQVQSTGISNFKFEYFLNNETIVHPAIEVQEEFGKIIEPIFNEIALFGQKNMKLREARDILLPKLISGELDVSDLDIVIREQENDT